MWLCKPYVAAFKTDMQVYFSKIFIGEFIDSMIWAGSSMFLGAYIFPELGMASSYGALFAIGLLATVSFWDIWSISTKYVADLEGNRTIEYYLTLPLPATLYFIKQVISHAARMGIIGLSMLPLAKLILLQRLDLSHLRIVHFGIILISSVVFCAVMSLIMASMVKDINNIGHVGIRILFPMWFFSGAQFSWQTLYKFSPVTAYICLINPLLYAMEGMRAAVLGQPGYLPFWLCVAMLWIFNLLFAWIGIVRMERRLDCV